MTHRSFAAAAVIGASLALAACGAAPAAPGSSATGVSSASTITNCGVTLTVGAQPKRIVATSLPGLETAVAMGLTDRIVGTAGVIDSLLPEYRDQAASLKTISTGGFPPPSKEAVLGVQPDFIVSGYEDDFGPKTLGDRATLVKGGLPAYVSEGTCNGATIEDARTDLTNYGILFNAKVKADELIRKMDDDLKAAPKAAPGVKVMIIQGTPDKPRAHGPNDLGNDMIKRAGATALLSDIRPGTEVSWETIIEAKPDVLVISETKAAPAAKTIAWIKAYAPAKDLPAVRQDRFVPVAVNDLVPGVRTGKAYRKIAEALAAK